MLRRVFPAIPVNKDYSVGDSTLQCEFLSPKGTQESTWATRLSSYSEHGEFQSMKNADADQMAEMHIKEWFQ